MTKQTPSAVRDHVGDASPIDDLADAVVGGGRTIIDRIPVAADAARDALAGAQHQMNQLSDMGMVATLGFAIGVTTGLLVSGAPRLMVILSAVPVGVTLRAAMSRDIRPTRLIG